MGLSESYTLWWDVRESTSLGDRKRTLELLLAKTPQR